MNAFDDLPPYLLDVVAAKIAEAVHNGYEAGRAVHADDVAKAYGLGFDAGRADAAKDDRYWAGYADAVEMLLTTDPDEAPDPTGIDPVTVEACRRLTERLSPTELVVARPHRHTMRPAFRTRRAGR